ncbi:MAG: hypothetical protein J6Y94_06930 [Bacteriovoracaceae bacterium]|nr:hypothetical protein [Bacteriovoracaceae bacterium]
MLQKNLHLNFHGPGKWASKFIQQDGGLLLLCILGQIIVLVASGFVPGLFFLGEGDGPLEHYPMYLHHYHYLPYEYTNAIQGGALYLSVYGMPFLYLLYSAHWVSLENYFLLLHFIFLIALPFYSLKIMRLTFLPKLAWAENFLLIIFFCSMPAMAIRLISSHSNLVYGSCFFFMTVSFMLAARQKQISLTLILFSILILLQTFPYFCYQMIHHGIFYAWPLMLALLGLAMPFAKKQSGSTTLLRQVGCYVKSVWINHRIFLLLALGCFGLCFYFFYGMYYVAQSNDLTFHLTDNALTFSFLQGQWRDWWGSLFFSKNIVDYQRIHENFNETNYPLGPLAILALGLFFLAFNKVQTTTRFSPKIIGIIIILWWSGIIVFCLNISPFSDLILKIVPLAKSFRIPQRTCFIACYVMQIIGCFVLYHLLPLEKNDSSPAIHIKRHLYLFFLLLFIVAVCLIPSSYLELFLDLVIIGTIGLLGLRSWPNLLSRIGQHASLIRLTLLVLCAALAIQGFSERTNHRYFLGAKLKQIQHTGDLVRNSLQAQQSNTYPMERVLFDLPRAKAFANLGEYTQVNALDGYSKSLRRFIQLNTDTPYHVYAHVRINPLDKNLIFLKKLYAVNYRVFQDPTSPVGWLAMAPLPRNPVYWMPHQTVQVVDSFPTLKKNLTTAAEKQKIWQQLWIVAEDVPLYEKGLAKSNIDPNANLILPLTAPSAHEESSQTILQFDLTTRDLSSSRPTPLVLALNYASILKVILQHDGQKFLLPTFVANGALLGVILPPAVHLPGPSHLVVKAVHPWFKGEYWIIILGGILIGLAFYFWHKTYHGPLKD